MRSAWAPALKCNHLLNDTFSSSIFSLHKNVIKPSHTGRRLTCDGRASEENIQKRKNISIVRPPLWPRCLSPHHQFCGTTQQSRAHRGPGAGNHTAASISELFATPPILSRHWHWQSKYGQGNNFSNIDVTFASVSASLLRMWSVPETCVLFISA